MWRGIIFIFAMFVHTAGYAGLIGPAEFPKTAADLSFVDRMILNTAGYEPYESEYDENGKCISGCAYSLPNIEDEIAAMERWNAIVKEDLIENHDYVENPDGTVSAPEYQEDYQEEDYQEDDEEEYYNDNDWNVPFPGESQEQESDSTSNTGCQNRNTTFENRAIPYRSPLGRVVCITSDYGVQRKLPWYRTTKIHYGIDLAANTGTPVYAPANGIVETVFNMNRTCGNGIVIKHSSGYTTQYCHLSKVSVSRGVRVSSGCLIGYTGSTGPTTGPHLHYAVKKNGKSVNPRNFIEPGHKMCH